MKTPEGYEKADLDKHLESIGAVIVKPATFGYGPSGNSDRICCIDGYFWAFEVKRAGKEPTALQWQRIREVKAAKGQAAWGTAEKIITELERWRQRPKPLLGG